MNIQAVARGKVTGAPMKLSGEGGMSTILVLSDQHTPDSGVDFQVLFREPNLARLVLDTVQVDDALMVVGDVRLDRAGGAVDEDLPAAWVCIEAVSVARELGTVRSTRPKLFTVPGFGVGRRRT